MLYLLYADIVSKVPKSSNKTPQKPQKASHMPCREGFRAVGTKCYRFIRERTDWHGAALICGSHGAGLARYDSNVDKQLKDFMKMIPKLNIHLEATTRTINCKVGPPCDLPKNRIGLTIKVKDNENTDSCRGKLSLSENKRQFVVKRGCKETNFIVETVDLTWVAGNTQVLEFGQRAGKAPFQVDAPRLIDAKKFGRKKGCFQASRDKRGQLVLEPNENCLEKLPYICGYGML
ncbi:hypothetical protein PoB_002570800 [Plakobranchus ocellatus]|uniref:C-type lectin domain-containing protein n=1 Tax=Plakobranchus ocellatus TaxID=259542 RepID=A0AAV3ZXR7_9GAST|nr:hypothetical protein PoB_002570800 [Plakobranchus ocellatus]